MHRRPLGRGRLLAIIGAIVILLGCLPRWYMPGGGAADLPDGPTINAFTDKGIVLFVLALLVLALVSLPYAAGDKPVAIDRALSYTIVTVVAAGAFLWRAAEFLQIDPMGLRPDLAPGMWIVGVGLILLTRATWEISRERRG